MEENPHAVRPGKFQHEYSVNVWAAMIDDKLIGPIELPNTMNGSRFLDFLRNTFSQIMEELPVSYRRRMWLQLDGAPTHYARVVRDYLK